MIGLGRLTASSFLSRGRFRGCRLNEDCSNRNTGQDQEQQGNLPGSQPSPHPSDERIESGEQIGRSLSNVEESRIDMVLIDCHFRSGRS